MKIIKKTLMRILGLLYIVIFLVLAVMFFPFYVLLSVVENALLCLRDGWFLKFVIQDINDYPNRLKLFLYGDYL